jgi:hypothetical protein
LISLLPQLQAFNDIYNMGGNNKIVD